jgi:CubicO group peptidase (beta-lactamase class C family)
MEQLMTFDSYSMRIQDSRRRGIVVLVFAALALAQPVLAATAPTVKQIDAIFSGVTSKREPGLAVVVRRDGHTVFERGYGMRDLRSGRSIDAHTDFRLASVTKQFTAMAVMLLVHDGKLHYEDHLTDIFSDFPDYGKQITIRNLLNHTSGLESYEALMDKKYVGKRPEEIPQITDAGVLALMKEQRATKFRPGTRWEYSNGGYCALAMVVQKVSGRAFGDFLRERIFTPLKMYTTLAYEYGKNEVPDRAYGYTKDAGVWLETDQSPTSATLGDGGVYTSVHDLIKWDDALRNHTLLSEEEMRPAITAVTLPGDLGQLPNGPDGRPLAYGFGWRLNPYDGHNRMVHSGGTVGFHTVIERFPTDRLTIIVLCNRVDLSGSDLAQKVADIAAHFK